MIVTALRGFSALQLIKDAVVFRVFRTQPRLNGWIDQQANEIAQKMGIEKTVKVFQSRPGTPMFFTDGVKASPTLHLGDPSVIAFNEEYNQTTPDFSKIFARGADQCAQNLKNLIRFSLSHELAHIKNNDFFDNVVLNTLNFLGMILFEDTIPAVSYFASIFVVKTIFSRFAEYRADAEACCYTTDEEKRAFVKFHQYQQENLAKKRAEGGLLEKFIITAEGDSRLSIFYPSMQSRLEKITAKIKQNTE